MELSDYLRMTGLTQLEFAQKIPCSQSTISQILSGKMQVSEKMAKKIKETSNGQVECKTTTKHQPMWLIVVLNEKSA